MAAQEGDADAADRLCDEARIRLRRLALLFGVTPDDVPDLVQDTLLAAWRNLAAFDPERGSFLSWIAPGLRGRATNRSRSGKRRDQLFEKARRFLPRFERSTARQVEARLTLDRLLQSLTERQREVVALYDIEGLSARETGRVLDLTEASVRSLARNARQRLREIAQGAGRDRAEEA